MKKYLFCFLLLLLSCEKQVCDVVYNSYCIDCNSDYTFEVGYDDECKRYCPNRRVLYEGSGVYKKIYCMKSLGEKLVFFEEKGKKVSCNDNNHFISWNDECYSCDERAAISVDSVYNFDLKEYSHCNQRTIIKQGAGNPLSVLKCSKDKPLIDSAGVCHSCDDELDVNVYWNEEKCRFFCEGKRFVKNGTCKKCLEDITLIKQEYECIMCGGFWQNDICVKSYNNYKKCENNNDCLSAEFCYLNVCKQKPRNVEKGWVCLNSLGGDNKSLYNLCDSMNMNVPDINQVRENKDFLMKLCGDDNFNVYVRDEYAENIGAFTNEGFFISNDKYAKGEVWLGTEGIDKLHLLCVK